MLRIFSTSAINYIFYYRFMIQLECENQNLISTKYVD